MPLGTRSARGGQEQAASRAGKRELAADVVIAGGGMGGCAAALAVQKAIHDERLLPRVREAGSVLEGLLRRTFDAHPHLGDIRGRGLFWGVELVKDRERKTPFDPALKLHARIKREAMALGLMVYPMGGTVDGRYGDHVLLAPPFIATDSELALIAERLHAAVQAAISSL